MPTQDELLKRYFLNTNKTQPEIVRMLRDSSMTECNIVVNAYKRYKMITTVVLFYSTQDLEQIIRDNSRVTDLISTMHIGDGFFTMVLLTFTTSEGGWKFAENLAYQICNKNIGCRYYVDTVDDLAFHNIDNFLGNFLFEIKDQTDCFDNQ